MQLPRKKSCSNEGNKLRLGVGLAFEGWAIEIGALTAAAGQLLLDASRLIPRTRASKPSFPNSSFGIAACPDRSEFRTLERRHWA